MRLSHWTFLLAASIWLTGCSQYSGNERQGGNYYPDGQSPAPGYRENRPAPQPTITHQAATPDLQLFQYSPNYLPNLTYGLSDWGRATLDGDIQRLLASKTNEAYWINPNGNGEYVTLTAGPVHLERRNVPVSRLYILNQTPQELSLVSGKWRSWGGALLRGAPTSDLERVIGRLGPASKVQVLGKVRSLDGSPYYLVGHEGIGIGYVQTSDLTSAEGWSGALPGSQPTFQNAMINLQFPPTITDRVFATVPCRNLQVGDVHMQTCQSANGRWYSD